MGYREARVVNCVRWRRPSKALVGEMRLSYVGVIAKTGSKMPSSERN